MPAKSRVSAIHAIVAAIVRPPSAMPGLSWIRQYVAHTGESIDAVRPIAVNIMSYPLTGLSHVHWKVHDLPHKAASA